MQYMLMIHDDGALLQKATNAESETFMTAYEAYTQSMIEAGILRAGERLRPFNTATTVRAPNGKAQVCQRPLRRTKGAVRRLLCDRGQRSRRSHQMGRALPERPAWRGRGAANLASMSTHRVKRRGRCERREGRPRELWTPSRPSRSRLARRRFGRGRSRRSVRDRPEILARAGCAEEPDGMAGNGSRAETCLDLNRRRRVAARSEDQVIRLIEEFATSKDDIEAIPDRRLALMFVCAHPAIEANIRPPLMMQTVLGLDAARIASAFLVAPATMGQRLSRAKAKI